jgi:hypothetical protein
MAEIFDENEEIITKGSILNNNKFVFFIILLTFSVFLLINGIYALIYTCLIALVSFFIIIIDNSLGKNNEHRMPFRTILLLISLIAWLIVIDYEIIILLFLFGVIIILIKSPQLMKKYKMLIPVSLILIIFFISNLPSNSFPQAFTITDHQYNIAFQKYDKRTEDFFSPYPLYDATIDKTFRSLMFIGIRTDMMTGSGVFNWDQANITVDAYFNQSEFQWNTTFRSYLVYYEGLVEDMVIDQELAGYELLDEIIKLGGLTEHYFIHHSNDSIHLEANQIHMGTYLLVLDILILPTVNNSYLYTDFSFKDFESRLFYSINNTLNYGGIADIKGYSYLVDYLTPRTEAENLFDDLLGNDIWNLMLLFFIVFAFSLFVSILTRKFDVVKTINWILLCVFIIGLFAVIATGMESVPDWITILFRERNGAYIWGIFESVKYCLSLGVVLGIIFAITGFVESQFKMIMVQTQYKSLVAQLNKFTDSREK